jgi:hypothetical protein
MKLMHIEATANSSRELQIGPNGAGISQSSIRQRSMRSALALDRVQRLDGTLSPVQTDGVPVRV